MENDTEEMVVVYNSSNFDAEMEVMTIKGLLDASGIPAMVIGPHVMPYLGFQVQVSKELAEKAQAVITEARAAGPAAAAEAEALTEE